MDSTLRSEGGPDMDPTPRSVGGPDMDPTPRSVGGPDMDSNPRSLDEHDMDSTPRSVGGPDSDSTPRSVGGPDMDSTPRSVSGPEMVSIPRSVGGADMDSTLRSVGGPDMDSTPRSVGGADMDSTPWSEGGPDMDSTLRSLGGCGRFQVLIVILVFLTEVISPFSLMFMTFGMYNPGWTCMDNTSSASITNVIHNITSEEARESNLTSQYFKENCQAFEACHQVQFNSESVTIVGEWQLICSKSWVPSLITSLQMVGVMIGAYLGGYLSDKIGRQRVICMNIAINCLCNLIAAFSVSWHMFIILRIFIGISYAAMVSFSFVFTSELTTLKWRTYLASLPAWNVGASLFAVTAMLSKNWRHIHLITAALSFLFFFPLLLTPESLRWLTVKGKMKKAFKVARQIASINKIRPPRQDAVVHLAGQNMATDGRGRKYSWYDLWRKEARLYTFILGFVWISMALIYYTTSFGAKNFVGDIYINLIILFLTDIPVCAFSSVGPNIIGRKWSTFAFFSGATISLFVMVFLDRFVSRDVNGTAIFAVVILARFCINGAWFVLYTLTAEIYPTVIRGTGMGFGSCMVRVGGIIAPYLVPKSRDTNFISFLIMACLMGVCSILLLFLPETKGKALAETWNEEALPSLPSEGNRDLHRRHEKVGITQ